MLIQSDFRHPAATISACEVHAPDVASLVGKAHPSAMSFYRANEAIFGEGDAAGPLYLVVTGAVRIVRLTADGRRQVTGFHFAGEVFGFEADGEHHCYAESVDGAGIRVLRPATGGFGTSALLIALKSLQRVENHVLLLGRLSATEKVAAFLLDLLERQDSDRIVSLPMQRSDIADYLGLTFETISRVLRVLKDRGLIRVPRVDQIEILDAEGLEALGE
jgi:CRP/FNR family transcriptional regulator, nitrogen fixation regulation protein